MIPNDSENKNKNEDENKKTTGKANVLDKLIGKIEDALESVDRDALKQETFKPVEIPMEFAFYREKTEETSEYQKGTVVGLSPHVFMMKSEVRVMVNSNIVFHGDKGKKFEGRGRVFDVQREKQFYQSRVMFMDIAISDGREHRRHERLDRRMPFQYLLKKGEPLRDGEILDISRSGLRFRCRVELKIGALIVIVIKTGKTDTAGKFINPAKVVWTKPVRNGYEIGASFLGGESRG